MTNKIVFLGLKINALNRGVSALTYGHIELLKDKFNFDTIYCLLIGKDSYKKEYNIRIKDKSIKFIETKFDWKLFIKAIFQIPFAKLVKNKSINPILDFFKDTNLVCVNNGGDSYTDIYGLKRLFLEFISIIVPELMGIKVIFTPQTIGPFNTLLGKIMGTIPLLLASKIFTRDEKGDKFLFHIGRKSIHTRDVSTYMLPQEIEYEIKSKTIGININGLMWENNYDGLENCFDNYKLLLKQLVDTLLKENYNVLLVPHTYTTEGEFRENDYKAILEFLKNFENNSRITYLDKEYTAPELKYIISQTEFFIGSRMHSNLAALTTNTPTVALSYSYKFDGTFNMFDVPECVINAKNIEENDIPKIVEQILNLINQKEQIKEKLKKVNSQIKEISFV